MLEPGQRSCRHAGLSGGWRDHPRHHRAADVGAGAAAQGIAAGEFDEFDRAIRAGATYVNVHSVNRPGGKIRAQLGDDDGDHDD